jgi:putative ABC transport system permease protein
VTAPAPPFEVDDSTAIESEISGLRAVAPVVSRTALVVAGSSNWRTQILGTRPAYFAVNGFELESGRWFSDIEVRGGASACIVGSTTRQELFGQSAAQDRSLRIGKLSCVVVGTLAEKAGSTLRDPNDLVVVPLRTYHRRLSGDRAVTSVHMQLSPGRSAKLVTHQIEQLMRERRAISPGEESDFNVRNMQDILETMSGVTGILTTLLGSIAAISLLVGGIGIMNIMLVSVTERTREIGIRLAVGAREREVLMQFLVEAVMLSAIGGVIGVVFGVGLGTVAAKQLGMPVLVSPQIVALSLMFSFFVGVIFGYLPARKAARLKPIEALRHE